MYLLKFNVRHQLTIETRNRKKSSHAHKMAAIASLLLIFIHELTKNGNERQLKYIYEVTILQMKENCLVLENCYHIFCK